MRVFSAFESVGEMHIIPELYFSFFAEVSEQIKCQKSSSAVSCVVLIILDVDGVPCFT